MISKAHVTTYLQHLTLFDSTLNYLSLGLTRIDQSTPMVKGVIEYAKHLVGAVLIDRDRNASKISDKICP